MSNLKDDIFNINRPLILPVTYFTRNFINKVAGWHCYIGLLNKAYPIVLPKYDHSNKYNKYMCWYSYLNFYKSSRLHFQNYTYILRFFCRLRGHSVCKFAHTNVLFFPSFKYIFVLDNERRILSAWRSKGQPRTENHCKFLSSFQSNLTSKLKGLPSVYTTKGKLHNIPQNSLDTFIIVPLYICGVCIRKSITRRWS